MQNPAKRHKNGECQSPEKMALEARRAGRILQSLSGAERNALLFSIADAMDREKAFIVSQNKLDIDAAREDSTMEKSLQVMIGSLRLRTCFLWCLRFRSCPAPPVFQDRLVLTESKLSTLTGGIRLIAQAPDAIGNVLNKVKIFTSALVNLLDS